jgi:hypothetical protein
VGISQDEAFSDLQQHFRRIWDSMSEAYTHYRQNYPDLLVHRPATRANLVSDLIFARIVSTFDDVPGTLTINKPNQLRFLSISDRLMLWFKKRDGNLNTVNFPTPEALKRDFGQTNLFEECSIVVAGYILNADETAVKCISFSPPNYVKPRWFIDVEAVAQPIQMKGPQPITQPKVRLEVKVGPKQIIL